MLGVVEHHEGRRRLEPLDDAVDGILVGGRSSDERGEGRHDKRRVVELGQAHDGRSARVGAAEPVGHREREARLADAPLTGERYDAALRVEEAGGDVGELPVAADQLPDGRSRSRGFRRARRRGGDVVAQNRGLELAELAARDKPELVVELPAVALEGVERVRLPPRPVAREHDQAHEPLAERVLGEQPLALVEHGVEAAEPKLRLETGLVRLDPPLVQPLSVEAQAALDRVGDRRPAPEVERRPQESDRARSVVVGK